MIDPRVSTARSTTTASSPRSGARSFSWRTSHTGETGARGRVDYEAGFAPGLEIALIFTCRADAIDTIHFDTRRYDHIVWKNPEELRESLDNRILATIGEGPAAKRNRGGYRVAARAANRPASARSSGVLTLKKGSKGSAGQSTTARR